MRGKQAFRFRSSLARSVCAALIARRWVLTFLSACWHCLSVMRRYRARDCTFAGVFAGVFTPCAGVVEPAFAEPVFEAVVVLTLIAATTGSIALMELVFSREAARSVISFVIVAFNCAALAV
jgi:hypothetical protein